MDEGVRDMATSVGAFSLSIQSTREVVAFLSRASPIGNKVWISRWPRSTIEPLLDLDEYTFIWLTDSTDTESHPPALERLNHTLQLHIDQGTPWLIVEGMEWLSRLHGEDAVLGLVRTISDRVVGSNTALLLCYDPSALDDITVRRILREAPLLEDDSIAHIDRSPRPEASNVSALEQDGEDRLMPSSYQRLDRAGFHPSVLRRRVLQWKRHGFDVSDLEPALATPDLDMAYARYTEMERRIERATSLLELIATVPGLTSRERTIYRFRLRQLTGMDEIEQRLDELMTN